MKTYSLATGSEIEKMRPSHGTSEIAVAEWAIGYLLGCRIKLTTLKRREQSQIAKQFIETLAFDNDVAENLDTPILRKHVAATRGQPRSWSTWWRRVTS